MPLFNYFEQNKQPEGGLLESEFEPHYSKWKQDPTPANTGKLVQVLNPAIDSAIKSFAGQSNPSPNLRTKAKLITIDAIKSYDPNKAKLRTHVMSQLQGLRRIAAKENQIINLPEQIAID